MTRPLIAALVCLFLVACATTPAPRDDVAPSPAKAKRAFVESSLVLVPESVGDFALDSATDYPGHPEWGVGIRYANPDFPDVRVDLYVYPIGRVERALGKVPCGVAGLQPRAGSRTAWESTAGDPVTLKASWVARSRSGEPSQPMPRTPPPTRNGACVTTGRRAAGMDGRVAIDGKAGL